MRRMLGVHTMPCSSGCPAAPCCAEVGASPSRTYSASMSSCDTKGPANHETSVVGHSVSLRTQSGDAWLNMRPQVSADKRGPACYLDVEDLLQDVGDDCTLRWLTKALRQHRIAVLRQLNHRETQVRCALDFEQLVVRFW